MRQILNLKTGFAAIALCYTACIQAAAPAAEQILPDDTLIMATIPNCAHMRELLASTPMGLLWNDPAMKPFKDRFLSRLREELLQPLERDLGVKLDDYTGLAQGQLTLALTANGWSGEIDTKPALVMVLDTGDTLATLEKGLATFRRKWVDAGKKIRTEQVRGVEFLVISPKTDDVPDAMRGLLPGPSGVQELGQEAAGQQGPSGASKPSASDSEIFLGRAESVLIAGNNLRVLERVVSRLTGGSSPVLADVEEFQSCQPVFFRDAQAFGWLNARRLSSALAKVSEREQASSEQAPDPFEQIKPEEILDAAGLKGLNNAAFAIQMAPEGALVQLHLGAPEPDRTGLLRILAGDPKETIPPPFVPADAVKFTRWRVDGQKAWETLTTVMDGISPTIMSVTDYFIKTADEVGKQTDENFDLRRQMIGNLGDDLIIFEKKPRDGSNGDGNAPWLMLIGSKAPEEMAASVKVLLGALSSTGKTEEREFLGRKIYSATSMAGPQLDPTNIKHRRLHLSFSASYVLASNDEAILEEFFRSAESAAKPLGELPGLLTAAQKVAGPGTSFFFYENKQELERVEYAAMKKALGGEEGMNQQDVSGMTPIPESFGLALPEQSLKEWFDYSLLPSFDAVAKYYGFMVVGGGANVDGLTLKIFTPTPVGLKQQESPR